MKINNLQKGDILNIDGKNFFVFNCQNGYGLSSIDDEYFFGDVFEELNELEEMINFEIDFDFIRKIFHYSRDEYHLKITEKE